MEIKFLNKTPEKRRIKITFDDKQVNYVDKYNGWLSMYDIHHDESRNIALKNLYWILGLDQQDLYARDLWMDEPDELCEEYFDNHMCEFLDKLKERYERITEEEYNYLQEHILSDYYKNKEKYPSFVDVKKIYNME